MKKTALFVLFILIITLAITGCTKKQSDSENSNVIDNGNNNVINNGGIELNSVEQIFHPATSSATGAYATIKVSSDIKFDDNTAWLGLCPAGKDYITELEADDVDVIWYNAEAKENEKDPHVFACDFSDVDDGTYALVVTSSDDENIGYVIIQLEMTKKGETLAFNYDNAKIKERPAK